MDGKPPVVGRGAMLCRAGAARGGGDSVWTASHRWYNGFSFNVNKNLNKMEVLIDALLLANFHENVLF